MLKSRFGKVEIDGSKNELYADLAVICNALYNEGVFTKEELHDAVNEGCVTDEELYEKTDPEVLAAVKTLIELLKEGENDGEKNS